jgi:hypothetical protein
MTDLFCRRHGSAVVALYCLLSTACADATRPLHESEECPSVAVEGTGFVVAGDQIEFRVSGADGHELSYELVPPPPSGGVLTIASNDDDTNLVKWNPTASDATETGLATYTFLVGVAAEGCGEPAAHDFEVIGTLGRFLAPLGEGVRLSLSERPCIEFPVRVQANRLGVLDVNVEVRPALPAGAALFPERSGKTKVFHWCPSGPTDGSEGDLTFVAIGPNGEFARKRFSIQFTQ